MKLKKQQLIIALVTAAAAIGFFSALLGNTLKAITEYYEHRLFSFSESNRFLFLTLPAIGLFAIYLLRHALFKNKPNKGIKEIFEAIKTKNNLLPAYKIPSHYFNGFLTVIFGGSTGIEVSTVVASAAIGSAGNKKFRLLRNYKNELICAGAAAGITALFNSPLAGLLFSMEVLSKRTTKISVLILLTAVAAALALNCLLREQPLFAVSVKGWNTFAIPYFILLGVLAAFNSVYLTRSVIWFKSQFLKIKKEEKRIISGALIIGLCLFTFPALFGEGYHAIDRLLESSSTSGIPLLLTFTGILILKPIVTSITLSAGGDGGIFAPSLFIGAFLGLLLAQVLNHYFNAGVIPVNFMIIGMAAVLSSSIHAPFTAIFVACGITGSYALIIPLLIACLISKFTSKKLLPYTVYSYTGK